VPKGARASTLNGTPPARLLLPLPCSRPPPFRGPQQQRTNQKGQRPHVPVGRRHCGTMGGLAAMAPPRQPVPPSSHRHTLTPDPSASVRTAAHAAAAAALQPEAARHPASSTPPLPQWGGGVLLRCRSCPCGRRGLGSIPAPSPPRPAAGLGVSAQPAITGGNACGTRKHRHTLMSLGRCLLWLLGAPTGRSSAALADANLVTAQPVAERRPVHQPPPPLILTSHYHRRTSRMQHTYKRVKAPTNLDKFAGCTNTHPRTASTSRAAPHAARTCCAVARTT